MSDTHNQPAITVNRSVRTLGKYGDNDSFMNIFRYVYEKSKPRHLYISFDYVVDPPNSDLYKVAAPECLL